MKSSGFYTLTFRIITDFKFFTYTFSLAVTPLFFIYVVGNSFIQFLTSLKPTFDSFNSLYV